MHLTKSSLAATERIRRLNLVNTLSGVRPAVLIGTVSDRGATNLAIFNSILHLSSNPALLGFILRPADEVRRHTWENIRENGWYTINHVQEHIVAQAHYTSAKFEQEVSEFEACGLTPEYLFDFPAPFVQESRVKMGMKFLETVPIEASGTTLVIGSLEHLLVPDEAVGPEGYIDHGLLQSAGVAGLNSYYRLEQIAAFPYARPQELPDFLK